MRQGNSQTYIEHGIRRKGHGYEVRVGTRSRTVDSLADARHVRRQLENEREQSFGQGTSREPLGSYLQRWLEVVKVSHSAGTLRAWEPSVRLRMLPHRIARIPLNELTPNDIQQWVLSLAATGVKSRTQHKYCECLSAALNDALEAGLIARNPFAGVRRPRRERYEPTVWNSSQVRTFLQACGRDGSRYAQILCFIAYTGCRVSEAYNALESDVDFEARTVRIRRGKTEASHRHLPLIREALDLLRQVQTQQERESPYWLESHANGPRWLFRRREGAQLSDDMIQRHMHRIAAVCGLPDCRVHDLRHHFGTAAKRAGVPDTDTAQVMGHYGPAVTREIYQHVDHRDALHVAEAVANLWRESGGGECPLCGGSGHLSPAQAVGSQGSFGKSLGIASVKRACLSTKRPSDRERIRTCSGVWRHPDRPRSTLRAGLLTRI